MDEKIRERMNGAFGNVQLSDDLKNQAEANLLKKSRRRGGLNFSKDVAVVLAAVAVFIVVNAVIVGLSQRHKDVVISNESTDVSESTETIEIKGLSHIKTLEDLESLGRQEHAFVKKLADDFYVAILCFDEDGNEVLPDSGLVSYEIVKYRYYHVEEDGSLADYDRSYDAYSRLLSEYGVYGACEIDGEWYEIIKFETTEVLWINPIMAQSGAAEEGSWRYAGDEELELIYAEGQFFMTKSQYLGGNMIIEDTEYNTVLGFNQVQNEEDFIEIMKRESVYSKKISDSIYLLAMTYDQNGMEIPYTQPSTVVRVGVLQVEGSKIKRLCDTEMYIKSKDFAAMGAAYYNENCYLIMASGNMMYSIIDLQNDFAREDLYCDEGICREILSGGDVYYFLRSTADEENMQEYWEVGDDKVPLELGFRKDAAHFPSLHDWDEMCTSTMSVRDIYVAPNWIGQSAKKFIELELFFDDLVMTDFEDGSVMPDDSNKNVYQINMSFLEPNFLVSTEPDSDEIIAVTLYGNHNYVTEDVWLGMNMEEVKKKMDIDDSVFFEEGVVKFASFERDGYLYELSFVVDANGNYLLGFSCISNAAKINSSSVKSFGERIKEGGLNAIYAQ